MSDTEDRPARATEESLAELHQVVAKGLTARVKADTATAADFTAAINFLRANDIKALPSRKSPLAALGQAVADRGIKLPFEGGDTTH